MEIPPHVELLMPQLQRWANRLRGRYGVPIYLVGSALHADNPDPRDWDIRVILPDDDFALKFGPVDEWRREGLTGNWTRTRFRWSDQCVKDTKDFAAWLHRNGDVQIYAESHAACTYADLPRLRIDSFPEFAAPLSTLPERPDAQRIAEIERLMTTAREIGLSNEAIEHTRWLLALVASLSARLEAWEECAKRSTLLSPPTAAPPHAGASNDRP